MTIMPSACPYTLSHCLSAGAAAAAAAGRQRLVACCHLQAAAAWPSTHSGLALLPRVHPPSAGQAPRTPPPDPPHLVLQAVRHRGTAPSALTEPPAVPGNHLHHQAYRQQDVGAPGHAALPPPPIPAPLHPLPLHHSPYPPQAAAYPPLQCCGSWAKLHHDPARLMQVLVLPLPVLLLVPWRALPRLRHLLQQPLFCAVQGPHSLPLTPAAAEGPAGSLRCRPGPGCRCQHVPAAAAAAAGWLLVLGYFAAPAEASVPGPRSGFCAVHWLQRRAQIPLPPATPPVPQMWHSDLRCHTPAAAAAVLVARLRPGPRHAAAATRVPPACCCGTGPKPCGRQDQGSPCHIAVPHALGWELVHESRGVAPVVVVVQGPQAAAVAAAAGLQSHRRLVLLLQLLLPQGPLVAWPLQHCPWTQRLTHHSASDSRGGSPGWQA
mmetsp:Transcript_8442/g.18071  ORF Transcript_8442/g.18071 Transcript_8442/m.18071 type:complete len:434 (-) Transcript_8442:495-1796(-)